MAGRRTMRGVGEARLSLCLEPLEPRLLLDAGPGPGDEFVWIEGEDFAHSTFNQHSWYQDGADLHQDLMSPGSPEASDGAWHAHYTGATPSTAEATYDFSVTEGGDYDWWVRLNPYKATYSYSLDGGPFTSIDLTADHERINLLPPGIDIRFLGWVEAGELNLTAGSHTVALRVAHNGDLGQTHGGVDAMSFVNFPWWPAGALKPGEGPAPGADTWYAFRYGEDPFSSESIIDMSGVLDDVAGEHGWLQRDGSDFRFEDGTPARFWGVNVGPGGIPETQEFMQQQARFYAKHGVNMVRVHPLESFLGVLLTDGGTGERYLDPDRLDRFDQWFAALRDNGIYMDWSVFYPHVITADDGYPTDLYNELPDSGAGKSTSGMVNFMPALQDAEWTYLESLLNHVNPYTGRAYREEAALAIVEVHNEDCAFWHAPLSHDFVHNEAQPLHLDELQSQFATWLQDRYADDTELAAAWGLGMKAEDSIYNDDMELYAAWEMEADGPFFNKSTEKARMGDFIRFLAETQRSYYEQRRSRMHSLGWQGVAVSTAWQAGGPAAQAANLWADDAMDAVSRHTYVGGGAGGHYVAEGAVNNSTHLDQPGQGILAGYSYGSDGLTVPLYQVEDKPAIKTEWNQNPPNQWRAEIAPLYAFYGMGLQGWDGSTHFTGGRLWMENGWPGAGRGPSSYVSETPLYMGQFPALSFAVYNGHIQEGELAAARRMGVEAIFQGIDVLSQDLAGGGFPGESSLYTPPEVGAIGRLTFKAGDGLEVSDSSKTDWDLYWDQPNEVITSMTGELIWDYGDRVVTVRGSRTQAVIGFAGGGHFDLPGVTVDVTTPFVSLLFTPLDNEPLIESEHILVTALAQDRQMGTEYSGDGSELLELGGPPLLLQPVEASITFKGADLLSARVVDVLGVPTETDVEAAGNTITIDGRYQTYYYEVRREPARPQPDLRVTDVSGPSQMTVDGAASVPVALQNDGSAASGAFEVGVFLSADEQYDGGDLLVASQGVSALPAGGSWSESVPVDLGAVPGAQTGFYHWIACADHLDAVEESNEGNNWLAGNGVSVQPEPLPDLTMASVDGPRHVYLDGSGEVAVTVENAGEGDAGASSLRLFLSSDGQYGPGDIELGSLTVPGIAGGDTWSGSVPFDLGATPGEETGDYYWIACVDPDDAVQESAEDNNWDAGNAVYVALSHSWRSGPVRVTIFDTAGAGAVDPDDFQVKFGNGGVKAIKLSGSRSMVGLGVTISGASSVGSIKDGRKGVPGQLAFIASDASIGKLKLKSGMTGYDLNAETLGGLAFPADVDGDGQSDDATAIYCEGTIGKFQFDGGVGGDIYIGGGGISLGKAKNNSGGYHGDLVTTGGIGKLQLGGSFGSSIRTGGSVGKFQLKDGAFGGTLMVSGHLGKLDVKGADVLAGARVRIGGELGKLGIKGSIRGAAGPDGTVQILAGAIGKVTVKGSVQNARILAGADLGEDWAVGGTGVDADTFRQGRLDKISIKGSVADSLIGAGLTSGGAGLDLDWLSANETFLDGSEIGKVNIKGSLTSSAATGMPFGIGSYRVGKVKVGRDREHPLVVTEV